MDLEAKRQQHADVPCNGCTACCKHDTIYLGRKDDPRKFKWHEEKHDGEIYAVLDRKDNGDCTYLTDTGCGIRGHAPDVCNRMDCRVLLLMTPESIRASRQIDNPQMALIYQAGAARLHTLEP
jgi:hypothetical protein